MRTSPCSWPTGGTPLEAVKRKRSQFEQLVLPAEGDFRHGRTVQGQDLVQLQAVPAAQLLIEVENPNLLDLPAQELQGRQHRAAHVAQAHQGQPEPLGLGGEPGLGELVAPGKGRVEHRRAVGLYKVLEIPGHVVGAGWGTSAAGPSGSVSWPRSSNGPEAAAVEGVPPDQNHQRRRRMAYRYPPPPGTPRRETHNKSHVFCDIP